MQEMVDLTLEGEQSKIGLSFENIYIGGRYTRPQLSEIWDLESYEALSKKFFAIDGDSYMVLFVTREHLDPTREFEDTLEDGVLKMEGDDKHSMDQKIIDAVSHQNQIHLFYRDHHHMPFIYKGEITLVSFERYTKKPSRFRFSLASDEIQIERDIATEEITHGIVPDELAFSLDPKMVQHLKLHVGYERNHQYRSQAMHSHGVACKVCGFDFNSVYGEDFANNFIEIHCIKPIENEFDVILPERDLIPVCSNCHSMAHRFKDRILTLKELQGLLLKSNIRDAKPASLVERKSLLNLLSHHADEATNDL